MSLTAHQCRALQSIERQLRAREPRLASMFTMFTTLTKDELLPPIETIQARRWQWLTESFARLRRRWRRHPGAVTQRRRLANVVFIPFIMVGLLVTVLVVGSHGSSAYRCSAIAGYHSAGVASLATPKCGSWLSQPNSQANR